MKLRGLIVGTACLLAMSGLVSVSQAYYEVFTIMGDTVDEDALSGYGTHGSDMPGMTVLAEFFDASTETSTWVSLGYPAGGAVHPHLLHSR